uniref:Uncharacterized protein n=1 Tax=Megaselia scalaris TaxID=36166 RepID=T1GMJ5_MEGSC
ELDIDYHKITPEELYQRFQTHPENISNTSVISMKSRWEDCYQQTVFGNLQFSYGLDCLRSSNGTT